MNYALIGDIHANIFSLDACIKSLEKFQQNEQIKFEKVFIIGDLLTYGVNINETLEKLINLTKKNNVEFILGNHDEMYHELLDNNKSIYFEKMPDWIKFSVEKTLKELDIKLFKSIKMKRYINLDNFLICHANCLILDSECKDKWIYIDSYQSYQEESIRLEHLNYKLAVYGHTHRRKIFHKEKNEEIRFIETPNFNKYEFDLKNSSTIILNTGSIGQPRSSNDLNTAWLLIQQKPMKNILCCRYINFDYDIENYINSIQNKYSDDIQQANKINNFFTKFL